MAKAYTKQIIPACKRNDVLAFLAGVLGRVRV